MTENHAMTLVSAGVPKERIYIMGISDPFGGVLKFIENAEMRFNSPAKSYIKRLRICKV